MTLTVPSSAIDLVSQPVVQDPYSTFQELRALGSIVWLERHRAWLLLDNELVRAALNDDALSTDTITPLQRRLTDEQRERFKPAADLLSDWMIFNDPPIHTALRDPVRTAFTPRSVARLREQIVASHPSLASRLDLGDLLDRFDVRYAETTGTAARLYPGCREGLDALRAAGIQLACVTNKEQRFARRVLEVTDLAHYFPVVLGGDTLAQKKPDPLVIEYCMQELGGDRRSTAHVGDSHIDVDTARNAGVAAWAVPYGYNAGVPIAQHQPDRVFDSLAEMARHVLALRAAPEHAR